MENLARKTAVAAGLTLIVYVILFFFVDRAVDLWIHNNCADTWVPRWGEYISSLAKGRITGLLLTAGFILVIAADPELKKGWTKQLLFICTAGAVAILIGGSLKFLLGRYRPVMFFEKDLYGLHFFANKWPMLSTPSGHTLRAFSVLTALSLLYRRLAPAFLTLAALIGISRVMVTAHYPSDVLFGAFIGSFSALWTYKYFFSRGKQAY